MSRNDADIMARGNAVSDINISQQNPKVKHSVYKHIVVMCFFSCPNTENVGVNDAERVRRMADGDIRMADRAYNTVKDLRAKVQTLGGRKFRDDSTGLEITYTELRDIEKFYENVIAEAVRRNGVSAK